MVVTFHAVMVIGWDSKVAFKLHSSCTQVALNLLILLGLPGPVTQILKSGGKYACLHAGVRPPQ